MPTVLNGSDNFDTANATDISSRIASAWVNFNGTGTVAIRDSYNVTSITDNGIGDYTVNFTNSTSDTNYAVLVCGNYLGTSTNTNERCEFNTPTTSGFNIRSCNNAAANSAADFNIVQAAVFGG